MPRYTQEQIRERFNKLPPVLKGAMFDQDMMDKIMSIGKDNDLTIEQIGFLVEEVGYFILGLMEPAEFINQISKRLRIDQEKTNKIASALNKEIFIPLREKLKHPSLEQHPPQPSAQPSYSSSSIQQKIEASVPVKPASSLQKSSIPASKAKPPITPQAPAATGATSPKSEISAKIPPPPNIPPTPPPTPSKTAPSSSSSKLPPPPPPPPSLSTAAPNVQEQKENPPHTVGPETIDLRSAKQPITPKPSRIPPINLRQNNSAQQEASSFSETTSRQSSTPTDQSDQPSNLKLKSDPYREPIE